MNAKNRSVVRVGWMLSSMLAIAAAGCATHVHQRTVYVPAPVAVSPPPPPPVVVTPQPPPPVVVVPSAEPAAVVVIQSANDFYEPLGAYGRWEVVPGYGRCWVPARVEVGWRPYSDGYWQRTDAGWYWASEEPWGWATYHYGRWDWNVQFGWFWMPQTQWAPAWVAWREGGGYVGWAPLRPSVTVGVSLTSVNYEPAFASRAFVFVEHRRMLEPVRPKTVVVNNTTIINKTVNITKVSVVNQTVINEGPRPDIIERESGRKLHSVAARDFRNREEAAVAGRNRNTARSDEPKISTPARVEVAQQPAPTPSPRIEKRTERTAGITQPNTSTRPAATAAPTSPGQAKRDEPSRHDVRRAEAPAIAKSRGQSVETKSNLEPSTKRPIQGRSSIRTVEKPAEVVINSPEVPVVTSPPRSNVRGKVEQAASPTRHSTRVVPTVDSKTEVKRETERSAKGEAELEPAKISRPTTPSPNSPPRSPQMSPREKSRSQDRDEVRPEERGQGHEAKDR